MSARVAENNELLKPHSCGFNNSLFSAFKFILKTFPQLPLIAKRHRPSYLVVIPPAKKTLGSKKFGYV